ncbi:uncharacterized protein METZ01_LOCUS95477 [marine metagenome]|uniref:Uncharacterized protein n=1 Tax=marine metagenome TaxID=408172 RepID=A0A381VSS9_9ZZZZ
MADEEAVETEEAVEETEATETSEAPEEQESVEIESWRDLIEDEKLQKHSERFTSIDALVQANLESRQKLSKAVVPPGKDAAEEDVAAYREALGVPKDVDGYEFPLPEGMERTDEMMDSEDHWSNIFIDNNIPKETADVLINEFRGEIEKMMGQKAEADQHYTAQSEADMRKEWAEDYDKNIIFASRASEALLGEDFETMRHVETADGRYILDNPVLIRMFAKLGRDMGEGTLGSVATDSEKETLLEQANSYRDKRLDAHAKGNNAEARRWDEKERLILEKIHGSGPIVGADTRTS